MTVEIPESDVEFDEAPIDAVKKDGDYYAIGRDGWTLGIKDPGFEPKIGQIARYYGRGIGYPVRGVTINGRVCYYRTPEEEEAEHQKQSAAFEAKTAAQTQATKDAGRDEATLRASEAPWPKTLDELSAYIKGLVEGPHDYGTCVYAMSLSAVAAFHYVCHELGTTGFQVGCADLDVLRRTRGLKGPFAIVDAEQLLYPQTADIHGKVDEWLEKWRPWLKEQATAKLAEGGDAHPDVRAHWKKLAK
jgi:hypothetical protein